MKTVSMWAWQGMPLNVPSPCLCSGPSWVPAQSISLLAHLSLVFRKRGFGEQVPGSCGVRMWPGANPEPETGNCQSICHTESHRNWGFLQVHHCCPVFKDWAHADPQEALQKGSNTTPYMTTACVYSRPPPHISDVFSMQNLWLYTTTVTQTCKWTLEAGQEKGSGHSFIALSCPTKYLLG